MFKFDEPLEKWHVLEADPTGEARVKLRQWTAGDRLAYQDAVSLRAVLKDEAGETAVRMGVMSLIHLATVAVEAVGFDLVTITRDGEKVREEFNPRLEEHLRALPAEVFGALSEAAAEFQPVPTSKAKAKAEAPVDELAPEAAPSDDDDPFPTPPTPASPEVAQDQAPDDVQPH